MGNRVGVQVYVTERWREKEKEIDREKDTMERARDSLTAVP